MRACPYHHEEPVWRYARNCTMARKVRCFMFTGCSHAEAMAGARRVFQVTECAAFAKQWNEHAEQLFAQCTAGARWTDIERTAFRARLWPAPKPVIPSALFDRNREETPAFRHSVEPVDPHHYAPEDDPLSE